MTGSGRWIGVLCGGFVAVVSAAAQNPQVPPPAPAGYPTAMPAATPPAAMPAAPAGPPRVVLSEIVDPRYRDAVLAVARKPTISTRGVSPEVVCTPAVYEWLLDHPDRVSLAWQRLGVPCVAIQDAGNGVFSWADGDGSELEWRTVGRFPDGLVWYATGKIKASRVAPTVPVEAVVVMAHPKQKTAAGEEAVYPTTQAFLLTDSRAAKAVLRVLGSAAPQLAQEGAEQLLFFFSGIARYAHKRPDKVQELLAPAGE